MRSLAFIAALSLASLASAGSLSVSSPSASPVALSLSGKGINNTVVLQAGGYRTWLDGSLAASCKEYRYPTGSNLYSGSTGDGVYRLSVSGSPTNVYCDMATDGGGWTLVHAAAHTTAGHNVLLTDIATKLPLITYTENSSTRPVYPSGQTNTFTQGLVKASTKSAWVSTMGAWVRFNLPDGAQSTLPAQYGGVLTATGRTGMWHHTAGWGGTTLTLQGEILSLWDVNGISPICGGASVQGGTNCPRFYYQPYAYHFDVDYKELYVR